MVGKYDIEIYNNRVHYFLTVKRNITILQGNSATGKTELIRLIGDYETNGNSSGITLRCAARCTVLTQVDWELRLGALHDNIIFIDETARFLKSRRFAELVRGSDNYFVIITRDDLKELPYSVEEIYGLRNASESSKYKTYKKVYNELYRLYNLSINERFVPDLVITEDSGSGYQCFALIYPEKCKSADGKSNIYDCIRNSGEEKAIVIVDGAAFGCEMSKVMRFLRISDRKCLLFAPESFEYLVLKSGIVTVPAAVINETYLYADSRDYLSWEEFYTSYLAQTTQNTIYQYSKSELKEVYKSKGSIQKMIQALPEMIRP